MHFSVRMRAAQGGAHENGGRHISGAERLIPRELLLETTQAMVQRQALTENISELTRPLVEPLTAAWERVCALVSHKGRQGGINHL